MGKRAESFRLWDGKQELGARGLGSERSKVADTKIEWATKVWNPVTGCTKISPGCKNCYMFREYPRLARMGVKGYAGGRPDQVRVWPDKLDAPLHWRKPARVFVNSMSDLFHKAVTVRFIAEVFNTMVAWRLDCRKRDCEHDEEDCYSDPGHTFLILTKRPERMLEILKPGGSLEQEVSEHWPGDSPIALAYEDKQPFPNIWLGVSVEDQKTADERIPLLLQTPAAVRFVSYEPALGSVNFGLYLTRNLFKPLRDPLPGIDLVIPGGESGPGARPSVPEWFRSSRDQAVAAGVSYFFKQWGEWSPIGNASKHEYRDVPCGDGTHHRMFRVGKKAAGRLLDGREWNEYPKSRS